MSLLKKAGGITLAAAMAGLLSGAPAFAQNVTVLVNGSPISFAQPPITRDGRVFVPLRGIFERLGASVVYANGNINATGNGRNVHLTIGSTQASVNGQPVTIDVAPFIVGATTLVPLRFIAQSLGAGVNWNAANNTVAINGGAYSANAPGSYSYPATTTGNFIRAFNPTPNSQVAGSFSLSGRTRPGSSVSIRAISTPSGIGAVLGMTAGRYQNGTTADANGYFTIPINIPVVPGGSMRLTIISTAPDGTRIQRNITYGT